MDVRRPDNCTRNKWYEHSRSMSLLMYTLTLRRTTTMVVFIRLRRDDNGDSCRGGVWNDWLLARRLVGVVGTSALLVLFPVPLVTMLAVFVGFFVRGAIALEINCAICVIELLFQLMFKSVSCTVAEVSTPFWCGWWWCTIVAHRKGVVDEDGHVNRRYNEEWCGVASAVSSFTSPFVSSFVSAWPSFSSINTSSTWTTVVVEFLLAFVVVCMFEILMDKCSSPFASFDVPIVATILTTWTSQWNRSCMVELPGPGWAEVSLTSSKMLLILVLRVLDRLFCSLVVFEKDWFCFCCLNFLLFFSASSSSTSSASIHASMTETTVINSKRFKLNCTGGIVVLNMDKGSRGAGPFVFSFLSPMGKEGVFLSPLLPFVLRLSVNVESKP